MKNTSYTKAVWVVLGWTILVILWGAVVRATGSGAGCGSHWPTCNGVVLPEMQATETIIEFVHRAMSGVVLLMVLGIILWGFRIYPKGHIIRKGLVATGAVFILEALLGAGLVLLELVGDNDSAHRAIAVALHLLNTFILLAILSMTAWWVSGGSPITFKNKSSWPLLFGLGLAGVALIGMTGAVTALGDTLFPPATLAEGLEQDSDPNAHFLIRLRILHPIIAILVGTYSLMVIRRVLGHFQHPGIRKLALALGGMILLQWTAGLVNVLLLAPIWMQLLHLLLADILWLIYVFLAAHVLAVDAPEKTLEAK